jgi:hypothetical protein
MNYFFSEIKFYLKFIEEKYVYIWEYVYLFN